MQIGSLVKSISGRDKGKAYVVISLIDERIVELVDGDVRTLKRPKRKNIKHLKEITTLSNLRNKILDNKQIFDKEINKAINIYLQGLDK